MARGIILTVGDSPEPIEFSLKEAAPEFVCFLCSPQSRIHLDRIVAAAGLVPSRYHVYEVEDRPAEVARLAHEVIEAYRWLQGRGVQAEDIVVDATGGRKWMSSAATLMAGSLGLRMSYVEVKYRDGRPDPTTMQVVSLANALAETGILEAARAVSLFNLGEFRAAADALRMMQLRASDAELRELAGILAELCALLEKWDRFSHLRESLAEPLSTLCEKLSRNRFMTDALRPVLDRLAGLASGASAIWQRDGRVLLADLLENARRCYRRGRHDDATARAYRTLEATAQWLLKERFGVETGKFSTTCSALKPSTLDPIREANCRRLPDKIALAEAWWVLALEGNAVATRIGGTDTKTGRWGLSEKLRGCLKARNESIYAHGFTAVGEKTAGDLIGAVEQVVRLAVGEDRYGELRRQVVFPELPVIPGGDVASKGCGDDAAL